MVSKGQYMWGQVVASIGRHFMAIVLLLCLAYPSRRPHPVLGVAASLVAAPLRSQPKIYQRSTAMQKERSLMLLYSISGKLIVSLTFQ